VKRSTFAVLRYAILALAGLFVLGIFAFGCVYVYLAPSLPTAESMRRVELQVPLRVYPDRRTDRTDRRTAPHPGHLRRHP
jgi:membrane carboxypeptidase/penicillin-binding protein